MPASGFQAQTATGADFFSRLLRILNLGFFWHLLYDRGPGFDQ
jgi:hypothetical protein